MNEIITKPITLDSLQSLLSKYLLWLLFHDPLNSTTIGLINLFKFVKWNGLKWDALYNP